MYQQQQPQQSTEPIIITARRTPAQQKAHLIQSCDETADLALADLCDLEAKLLSLQCFAPSLEFMKAQKKIQEALECIVAAQNFINPQSPLHTKEAMERMLRDLEENKHTS